jgi:hypothetical protein
MADHTGGSGMSKRPSKARSSPADETKPQRKDENWDDRLRRVGDANYVAVDWSPHDNPNWPLPTD